MKSLFLLIALYTISGKQAVPSGDLPSGSLCTYEQTGNRSGQMTAGNELTFTLSGYDGLWLHSVTLSMHSNTSAGAGSMQLTLGESVLWSIEDASFDDPSWAGAYSTSWVDLKQRLTWVKVNDGAELVLHIQASKNSLYLQSVAVEYSAPQEEVFTVSFETYTSGHLPSLTETGANSGVELPEMWIDDATWQFYGWSSTPIEKAEQTPAVYKPGTIFYPSANCTLHAVYVRQGEQQPWLPTDDLTMDDYMIALYEPVTGLMLHAIGAVENGMLATVNQTLYYDEGQVAFPQEMCSGDAIYTLSVVHDTLTIRHKATNTAVKPASGGKFSPSGSNVWTIAPMEVTSDQMPRFCISGMAGAKVYYVSFYLGTDAEFYFRPTADAGQQHDLLLYALADMGETSLFYSSYAFGTGSETLYTDEPTTYQMLIGPCKLMIKDGKKYMQINE